MGLRERVIELFEYDPDTGVFKNRISRGRAKAEARAGSETGHGYRKIVVDYKKHYEHHLAWLIVHGVWPEGEMDHADGNRSNNAIGNLRLATRSQNRFNSCWATGQSGLRGAYLDKRIQKWYSKIEVDGRVVWLGHYKTSAEAHAAYCRAVDEFAGEYAFRNRVLNPPIMEVS